MTENKRFIETLKGQLTDRPPFWFMRQAGRYLPEYMAVRKEAGSFLDLCYNPDFAVEVTLQPLRRYDMDAAILFSDILVIPHALGQHLEFRQGEGPVLEPVDSVAKLDALSLDHLHDKLAPVYETVSRLSTEIPSHTALIGFAGAPWTVATYMVGGKGSPDQAAARLWAYRDEVAFQALMDLLVEATSRYLIRQVEQGAEVLQIFDTWAGNLPMGEFRKWCMAPTKKIVDNIRARFPDMPIIGFPRGAGPRYPDYVRETGVTAVSIDTSMPADWARDNIQMLCPVQGNLDPLLLVSGGEALKQAVTDILDSLSGRPFIFNLGHGIVPQTPPEHVALVSEMIKEYVRSE
ncbi:uroporphyrinogen decarboxylase [Emcibacter nanhaiensis]|uniref:Uroporphyrinogen decarboxylase n=1 Tax=Emcibacter nanhaiensis TaxID=1505037 RepID=A0A501PLQ1_9PROT|nr:uroporphyrinogen decarboxylase [Emcibacter nanhaiensis]TPD61419.1 uroporphyrinogen decarboxylase [Emcibacter nanhaiensis]